MGKGKNRVVSTETLAKAMTHTLRRQILRHMRETGEPIAAVEVGCALMAGRKEDTTFASYHVGRLKDLGLVEVSSEERVRGMVKTYYVLTDAAKVALTPAAPLAEVA
jgi:DNA-binding transcriptional ArsR family regulator